jgi:hypothetical protein
MSRKAFNFFRSYYEVAIELKDSDRLAFYDALITLQFTGKVKPLTGLARFAFISQKHSILSQIEGWNNRLKQGDIQGDMLFIEAPHGGGDGGGNGGAEAQGEGEGQVEVQYVTCFSFEDFWSSYPNKVNKKACKQKYSKLPELDRQKIKDTIKIFAETKPFKDYNHPYPETYINQRRWEDEIPTVKTQPVLDFNSPEAKEARRRAFQDNI